MLAQDLGESGFEPYLVDQQSVEFGQGGAEGPPPEGAELVLHIHSARVTAVEGIADFGFVIHGDCFLTWLNISGTVGSRLPGRRRPAPR